MSNQEYRLHYGPTTVVSFPSQKGMKSYLTSESSIWAEFLGHVRENLESPLVDTNDSQSQIKAEQLASAFEAPIGLLPDMAGFNSTMRHHSRGRLLPPPSDSLDGQLILGLFQAGMADSALAAYLYVMVKQTNFTVRRDSQAGRFIERGKLLVEAAPIVKALPYSRVSTSKMAGAVRTAENHVKSLADEIAGAQNANAKHARQLQAQLDEQNEQAELALSDNKEKAKRVNDVILRLHRRRDRQHRLWVAATTQLAAEKFEEADKKVYLFERKGQLAEAARVEEFNRLKDLFETQLRLRAPVSLWKEREEEHKKNSSGAMWRFIIAGVVAMIFGVGVPSLFGDYIANSFSQVICETPATADTVAQGCERIFSAKGPVTITGLLLVMSVLMWLARLQYRIHLSERHLALDASEKKAFAETFMAMKEGKDVRGDSEAIVLASLFRPTQDGIIRDDEAAMDLSAVALMAKQFSRNN